MSVAAPFVVKPQWVINITGGWLKSEWIVADATTIDGKPCIPLRNLDRRLAQALGMNISLASPLSECSILAHLADKRDEEVDQWIRTAKGADDPMAEVVHIENINANINDRSTDFAKYKVPQLVSIDMPAFVLPDGGRVDPQSIEVVTTPRRRAFVTMVATADNLNWLAKAAELRWDATFVTKRRRCEIDFEALPTLGESLKYKRDDRGQLQIYGRYREGGYWKGTVRTIKSWSIDGDDMDQHRIIRLFEAEMLDTIGAGRDT